MAERHISDKIRRTIGKGYYSDSKWNGTERRKGRTCIAAKHDRRKKDT